jgi:predicted HicB family RNase H-like nuclease
MATKLHTVRISDEIWAAAQAKAAERGESVSDVIRRALVKYSAAKSRS